MRTNVLRPILRFYKLSCKNIRIIKGTALPPKTILTSLLLQFELHIVKQLLNKKIGISTAYTIKLESEPQDHLQQYLVTNQTDLPTRTMQDSFASAIIPLSTDEELRNKYTTFIGNVRFGRLLEDMDIFAAYISHLHVHNPKIPLTIPTPYEIVTVLVDKINFTDYAPKSDIDIRLSGHVSWVGKSSIEVVVWLEQHVSGEFKRITRALFLMAARDIITHKAAIVNPVIGTNDREKRILEGGQKRKDDRWLIANKHLTKVIPNEFEQKLMHDLFIRTIDDKGTTLLHRSLPEKCVWMEKCSLCNIISSFPENRNFYYRVFGGFIMRQALELSWALAYFFCKHNPTLITVSDINFYRPVKIHNFVKMKAYVVFTKMHYFQISVSAEIWDQRATSKNTTSTFYFTYAASEIVKEVFPYTYQEAILYIDGYRHFTEYIKNAE